MPFSLNKDGDVSRSFLFNCNNICLSMWMLTRSWRKLKARGAQARDDVPWSEVEGRGWGHLERLEYFWKSMYMRPTFVPFFSLGWLNNIYRPPEAGFGCNKIILYVFQCRHDIRNLPSQKQTFWAKSIPYLEWGRKNDLKINKFPIPGNFCNPGPILIQGCQSSHLQNHPALLALRISIYSVHLDCVAW